MPTRPEVAEFLTHLAKERGQSPHTVKAYGRDLEAFTEFCDRHYGGAWTWRTVDRLGIRGFLGELHRRGLAKRSAARALSAVRSLYRWLQENHGVPNNVARAARVPRLDKRLPTYLDREQTQALFDWAEARAGTDDFAAARDLAMLELFYSTGIRLSELSGMNLDDLDLLSDQAKVRGKGRKERIVPVGSRAVLALRRYLGLREPARARPGGRPAGGVREPAGPAAGARAGCSGPCTRCSTRWAATRLRVHSLRHTFATHMLDAGRRSPGGAGAAGPRVAQHDPGVHPYQRRAAQEGVQPGAPAGVSGAARAQAGSRRIPRRRLTHTGATRT